VRPFAARPRIGDAIRISVGPWALLERCLEELRRALDASVARGAPPQVQHSA
jgi:hypothetical protein